jgi:cytochrome b6-f complex iron-sulfur subunit
MTMKADLSRRDFIRLSTRTFLGLGAILGLGGLIRYFSFEPDQGPASVFDLGDANGFPKGSRTIRSEVPAVIINQEGVLQAISLTCTHLGCTIEENKENGAGFTCPCHGSAFDGNGKVINGPAQKPLRSLRVEITGENKVMVYTE